MHWGKHKENGIWIARRHQRKVLIGDGRLIYLALGRLRLRLMWPHNPKTCSLSPCGDAR